MAPPSHDPLGLRLGALAREKGLITLDQLRQAMDEQARDLVGNGSRARALGAILVARGFLKEHQLAALLEELKDAPPPSDIEDAPPPPLGAFLVRTGRITQGQLDECVGVQQDARRAGAGDIPRLGELLIRKGYVTDDSIRAALADQQKTILVCASCGKRFNVKRFDPVKTYRCTKCKAVLPRPPEAGPVGVDESGLVPAIAADLPPATAPQVSSASPPLGPSAPSPLRSSAPPAPPPLPPGRKLRDRPPAPIPTGRCPLMSRRALAWTSGAAAALLAAAAAVILWPDAPEPPPADGVLRPSRDVKAAEPPVRAAALAGPPALLAAADARGLRVWDLPLRADPRLLPPAPAWTSCAAFTPDGKLLAAGGSDGGVRVCDPASGRELRRLAPQSGPVRAVAFSPDGRILVAAGWGAEIRFWNVPDWDAVSTLSASAAEAPVLGLAFRPDGKVLAAAAGHGVTLWDLDAGRPLRRIDHGAPVRAVAFSPDGAVLAAGRDDGIAALSDAAGGALLHALPGHVGGIAAVAFRPAPAGALKPAFPPPPLLVTGGDDATLRAWDPLTGLPLGAPADHPGSLSSVSFSPDGRTLAAAGGGAVRIWEVVQ